MPQAQALIFVNNLLPNFSELCFQCRFLDKKIKLGLSFVVIFSIQISFYHLFIKFFLINYYKLKF